MTLDHLADRSFQERRALQKAKTGLERGLISQAEYDFFLKHELGMEHTQHRDTHIDYAARTTLSQRRKEAGAKMMLVLSLIFISMLTLWMFTPDANFTGMSNYEPENENIKQCSEESQCNETTNTTHDKAASFLHMHRLRREGH